MKKAILIALGVIAVCSVFLAGTVSAAKEGFGFQMGGTATAPTIDGTEASGEWDTDSFKDLLWDGWTQTTSYFRTKWSSDIVIAEYWLISVGSDTSNDAGDYVKLSVDNSLVFGEPPEGGAAPTEQCFQLKVMGDGTMTMEKGTGTGWGPFTAAVSGTDYDAKTTVSGARVYEIFLDKGVSAGGALAMGYHNNARIEVYDASTGKTLMFPPDSSADVPDSYAEGTTGEAVPEVLSVVVMLSLSTIAALVSTRYFRKPRI